MNVNARDDLYVQTLLAPLELSAGYLPKMGTSSEVDYDEFTLRYGADPLYHWMGLDSPLMFAAHKAAGGMTSIYRQLGIGTERLFRQILCDELKLTPAQVKWSYELVVDSDPNDSQSNVKTKILHLDGRVELDDVVDTDAQMRIRTWIEQQRHRLNITAPLKGAVFEVRQGYKSADSKRQNADLTNASQALGHCYLPVLAIMSTQINKVVKARYTTGNWCVLMGDVGGDDPLSSTFDFLNMVVGYDLVQFFERNTDRLRSGTDAVLRALLEAK